jgi:hypothetical protein
VVVRHYPVAPRDRYRCPRALQGTSGPGHPLVSPPYWDSTLFSGYYLEERVDGLEAKIQRTDDLIDETVYDLYGLTEEEIAVVDGTVGE